MPQDKQLRAIKLDEVLEKRRLDQALNTKEFAVLAGVSHSTARQWFRLPGFPVVRGVLFWEDFVRWRQREAGLPFTPSSMDRGGESAGQSAQPAGHPPLSPRAAQILAEAG